MSSGYQSELTTAVEALRVAAQVCRSVQAKITPDVMEKKDRSPVTVADFASQAVICRALQQSVPDDPIVGEEDAAELRTDEAQPFLDQVRQELASAGLQAEAEEICGWIDRGNQKDYTDRFWTLDPIDGTKGFLRKGQYAISLALIVEGSIELALLCCPNLAVDPAVTDRGTGVILFAERGHGSREMALDGDSQPRPITVATTSSTAEARFCESVESGHSSHGLSAKVAADLGIEREPARLDSQAKYAVVARGEAEIYLRLPANRTYREKIWDHAGGVLIVEEAGGMVTDVMGRPLDFTHGQELSRNRGVVATNRELHSRVLSALEQNYEGQP